MKESKKNDTDLPLGQTPWQRFEDAMRRLVSVPHSAIKDQLDAEDKVRRRKRTRSSKIRAFRDANKNG